MQKIENLKDYSSIESSADKRQFFSQTSSQEIAEILSHSPLPQVGWAIRCGYRDWQDGYTIFRERYLIDALGRSSLDEIKTFIAELRRTPKVNKKMLGELAADLRAIDLTRKFLEASAEDLDAFLHLVYADVEKDLAAAYCQLLDSLPLSDILENSATRPVCMFLWTLTCLGDLNVLATARSASVQHHLANAWVTDVTCGAKLLGVMTLTWPEALTEIPLPTMDLALHLRTLSRDITYFAHKQDSHTIALILRGLRCVDSDYARVITRDASSIEFLVDLLGQGISRSIGQHELTLLLDTLDWLSEILSEETMNWLNQLESMREMLDKRQAQFL